MPYADNPNAFPPRGTPYGQTGVGPPGRGSSKYGGAQPPPHVTRVPPPTRSRQQQQQQSPPPPQDPENASNPDDNYSDEPEQPQRQWKYSSANMRQTGNCRKYCCIALLFLAFLAFSIGISVLIDKLFFQEEDNTPQPFASPHNSTFPYSKSTIDTACGTSTYDQDGGIKCKQYCQPSYSDCCDPLDPDEIYDFSGSIFNASGKVKKPPAEACDLGTNTPECMSYAKCIGSVGQDPAPAALTVYCTEPRLSEDDQACMDICERQRCCYAQPEYGSMHCLSDKLQVCLDYAPCQNLRKGPIVKVAPENLDQLCYQDEDDCVTACKEAECCNIGASPSCFQDNFVSCLTYAACSYSYRTRTNITVAPRFSVLPLVPKEMDGACMQRPGEVSNYTCEEYCVKADCCYSENPTERCFEKDPLGCIAWDQQCQAVKRFQPPS